MDRIKRLSYDVLGDHKSKFGEDFVDNKKILDQVAVIRSKELKNEIAGYITKLVKKEIREAKSKQSQTVSSKTEEYLIDDKLSIVDDDLPEEQVAEINDKSETDEVISN
jgi:small subunit ribosomal protein S17e